MNLHYQAAFVAGVESVTDTVNSDEDQDLQYSVFEEFKTLAITSAALERLRLMRPDATVLSVCVRVIYGCSSKMHFVRRLLRTILSFSKHFPRHFHILVVCISIVLTNFHAFNWDQLSLVICTIQCVLYHVICNVTIIGIFISRSLNGYPKNQQIISPKRKERF